NKPMSDSAVSDLPQPDSPIPILARLEGLGWLCSGWEDADPTVVGRPRRRFYQFTAAGVALAEAAVEAADARRSRLRARRAVHQVPQIRAAQP
ncbi:MAG: hypothetical protein ABIU87_01810, partial [Ornithinibacter sp.]